VEPRLTAAPWRPVGLSLLGPAPGPSGMSLTDGAVAGTGTASAGPAGGAGGVRAWRMGAVSGVTTVGCTGGAAGAGGMPYGTASPGRVSGAGAGAAGGGIRPCAGTGSIRPGTTALELGGSGKSRAGEPAGVGGAPRAVPHTRP